MGKITPAYSLTIRTACLAELKKELSRIKKHEPDNAAKLEAVLLQINSKEKQCG